MTAPLSELTLVIKNEDGSIWAINAKFDEEEPRILFKRFFPERK